MTAQAQFARMMKDEVAPGLRQLGLRGSGNSFSIPSDDYWAIVGFQKDRHSDGDCVRFTINVKVVSHEVWDAMREFSPWKTQRPSANESLAHHSEVWDQRIGFLLPAGHDHWWELRAGDVTHQLASEVLAAIGDFALPAMRAEMI